LGPDGIARELARIAASSNAGGQPALPYLEMPARHDIRTGDVIARRLYGNLAAAANRGPAEFPEQRSAAPRRDTTLRSQ
jgi:uncharacterized protein